MAHPQTKGWRKAKSAVLLSELLENKKISEVAKIEGVRASVIHERINWPEYQELVARFAEEMKNLAKERVDALWDSDDPQDRRTAATLTVQMFKILSPKVTHTDTHSLTYSINARQMEIQEGMKALTAEEDEALKTMLLKVDRGQ